MGKPVLKSRGLLLEPITVRHVDLFMADISVETAIEFDRVYNVEPLQALLDLVDVDGQYAVTRNGSVLCLTGIWEEDEGGLMWAVFTNEMKRNFVRFARASSDLIDFYMMGKDFLACDVWVKSGMIMQWLAMLDFKPHSEYWRNEERLIRFCCNERNIDLPSEQRPVIH